MRRYSAASIASLAYQSLHQQFSSKFNEMRSAPWLAILIAKWALQDLRVSLERGTPMPQSEFDRIREELWELQGQAAIATGSTAAQLFRNAINVQLDFQRLQPYAFLRWPALVDELSSEHEMKRLFADALQMEPQAYSDHALAVFALLDGKRASIPLAAFAPLVKIHGATSQKFFDLVARDLPSLRIALQADDASRVSGAFELFQSPFLKRYPLLRLDTANIGSWHPMILARGMEDIAHLRLSALGQQYPRVFSKVFEHHVVGQLDDIGASHISEEELKATFGHEAPTVEAVIECRDCNVFIESKMSLFWDQVLVSDTPDDAFAKALHVRKAILQGLRVGELIRSPRSPFVNCAKKDKDYLIIVTSRELNMGGGKLLERLLPANALADVYPEAKAQSRSLLASKHLSPERIFILSIDDYERLVGTIGRGRVDLQDILQYAASQNADPSTAHMYFSDYLAPHARDGWPIPRVTENYWQLTRQRLEEHLPPS